MEGKTCQRPWGIKRACRFGGKGLALHDWNENCVGGDEGDEVGVHLGEAVCEGPCYVQGGLYFADTGTVVGGGCGVLIPER